MALRTTAMCNGKIIGIETIFTIVEGKQINIPDKLNELRKQSQNGELLCPCGCGAGLILVAGDKNLREQHFRIKNGEESDECTLVTEGKLSLASKIVLKCWLDEKLRAEDLEARVPICAISDSSRRYEFTFLSRSRGFAVDYCYNRTNLSDDKQSVIEENSNELRVIHIVDYMNSGCNGQYPEGLMKVQGRQGYCLFLSVADADYNNAKMKAMFYDKDFKGIWKEIVFADGLLKDYRIDIGGNLFLGGARLVTLAENAKRKFQKDLEEQKKNWDEYIEQKRSEEELERKRKEEIVEMQRRQAEELAREKAMVEERRRIEAERKKMERQQCESDFMKNMEEGFSQQEKVIKDPDGNRWVKCEVCGKIAKVDDFTSYGGPNHINLGKCKECFARSEQENQSFLGHSGSIRRKQFASMVCPECGGRLMERNGRNGKFLGCSNFPNCRYTRSI